MEKFNKTFEYTLEIPRIKIGKKQTVETLINEEALRFANLIRNEKSIWKPRLQKF